MTRKVAVLALKGGVGKSSVVAGLVKALACQFKVGALDIDVTGSNLYSALGLEHSPKWQLDTEHEKIIVPKIGNYWLLSVASHVGENQAVLWGRSQHLELARIREKLAKAASHQEFEAIADDINAILANSKWRLVSEILSTDIVTWPEALDYLVVDLPPSVSDEIFSFLDTGGIYGIILVSLPTEIANIGLTRTIDLLRVHRVPIIGIVANMDGFLTKAGAVEYQFLSPRVDLEKVARRVGIPFLISIPQTADPYIGEEYFRRLSEKVVNSQPVVLKEDNIVRKLKRTVVKGMAGL